MIAFVYLGNGFYLYQYTTNISQFVEQVHKSLVARNTIHAILTCTALKCKSYFHSDMLLVYSTETKWILQKQELYNLLNLKIAVTILLSQFSNSA